MKDCLGFGILGLLQQSYGFHVIGLREHIDEAEFLEGIPPLRKEAEVPGKGRGFARDIDDFFGFQSYDLIQDGFTPFPRRVEDDEIRWFPFPIRQDILYPSLNEVAILHPVSCRIEPGILEGHSILFNP